MSDFHPDLPSSPEEEFKPLSPTPRSGWAKSAIFRLPSGNIAELRSVDFTLFAKIGRIPDGLTPLVEAIFTRGDPNLSQMTEEILKSKSVMELLVQERETLEAFARVAFVNPRIVDHPQGENEISPEDVGEEDLRFVMSLLGLPTHELQTFSQESNQRLASLESKRNTEESPKRSSGNKRVGKSAHRNRRHVDPASV